MTRTEVQKLRHGLYQVYWNEGNSSLASVGSNAKGQRWLAPTNWVTLPDFGNNRQMTDVWLQVERVEPLAYPEDYR